MIRFATDLNGNRVYIENAKPKHIYTCEYCNTSLTPKFGNVKSHHFAHKKRITGFTDEQLECTRYSDSITDNQMSKWHKDWQELFPIEQREIVVKADGKKFRADILREEQKEVIEFQHTQIREKTFRCRNEFYTSQGYKIIWLFDFDVIKGKVKYVYPDKFEGNWLMRKGDKLYRIDMDTYKSMFGEFMPQFHKNIVMCFSQTHKGYTFIKYIDTVEDSNYWDLGEHPSYVEFIVRDIRLNAFKRRIGIE